MRARPPFFDDGKSGRAAFPEGSAEFDRILNERGCEKVTQFYRYWQSRKSGNLPPRRRDIDPIDIPQLLANTLLLEIIGQPAADFRYRLIGTQISEFDSANFTGMLLSEVIPKQAAFDCVWEHHLHAARGQVEIRIDTNKWLQDNSRATISYLILLLPLRGEADDIQMLFGYIQYFLDAQDRRPAG